MDHAPRLFDIKFLRKEMLLLTVLFLKLALELFDHLCSAIISDNICSEIADDFGLTLICYRCKKMLIQVLSKALTPCFPKLILE
jgi:hypothetical protein